VSAPIAQAAELFMARPDVVVAIDIAVMFSFNAANAVAVCIGCGCTDLEACEGGCSWVSLDPPVCSACVEAA